MLLNWLKTDKNATLIEFVKGKALAHLTLFEWWASPTNEKALREVYFGDVHPVMKSVS